MTERTPAGKRRAAAADRRAELKRKIWGYRASQCVRAAALLGLPDHLAAGPLTAQELASRAGADAEALARLLRALVGLRLLRRRRDGRFALTPLGEPLRAGAPDSLRDDALHALGPTSWLPWGELVESVRSGAASFPRLYGESAWEHRARNAESRALFDAMARARSRAETAAILARLALPRRGLVVDLGGGRGELLAAILARRPELTGALFELPEVLAGATALLRDAGVASRCRLVAGDLFAEVPAGGDLYLLKAVLHNWDDAAALRILRNCRKAMSPRARLVIVESLADVTRGEDAELQDLHMLVMHGGRERVAAEIEALLREAGLRCTGIRKTAESCCLIESVPARRPWAA